MKKFNEIVKGFKGFDKGLKCRGFQFEPSGQYEQEGEIECCESWFHFCEYPLDVFGYYPPADSRYCEVEGSGVIDKKDDGDSKMAASQIRIGVEIGLPGLIKAGVEYIKSKVDWTNAKESNTGYRSAATNTGNQSAATNTGYRSAATNTGDQSAATNTGNQSAATNTGYRSAANVSGKESVACGLGIENKVKGALGCYLVAAEWEQDDDYDWRIKTVQTAKVDGEHIKPDIWYMVKDGQWVEVSE